MSMISKWVVGAAILLTIGVQHSAQPGFVGAPMALKAAMMQEIKPEARTPSSFAFTMLQTPADGVSAEQPQLLGLARR